MGLKSIWSAALAGPDSLPSAAPSTRTVTTEYRPKEERMPRGWIGPGLWRARELHL
jgi:hypothetical protein